MQRALGGDEAGFVELWRALQPPLLRYLTVRSNGAAEDLAAETWLQVVRDLHSFNGDIGAFRGWLFTVARHRAVDDARARAVRPGLTGAGDGHNEDPCGPSAEHVVLEQISTQEALALVASLPADQAEMVMLRVVAGLDVQVVADLVGKRPGTVRVAVHRALRKLSDDPRLRVAKGGAR